MGTHERRAAVLLDIKLPVDPRAAAAARHSVVGGIGEFLPPEVVKNIELLVSELVTNSVRHGSHDGQGWIEVHLSAIDDTVRLEVVDAGRGFQVSRPVQAPDGIGRWGLYLVEKLSTDWGIEADEGTKVWARVRVP